MIFPALYNGPVQYFARLVREEEIILEQFDSYTKQTYRNRCRIVGPNGTLTLSIPVKRIKGTKTLFKDVRVDYDTPWNRIHWKSLVAAYASSPFFEFFEDELLSFYEEKFGFLVDLNARLLDKTMELMGISVSIKLSEKFVALCGKEDPRHFIHPKLNILEADPLFTPCPYHQVFEEKLGFQPNLSILDLLFNEGPDSLIVLKKSLKI